MNLQTDSQKEFSRVLELSSATGFGSVLALSQGLGGTGRQLVFHFSIWTVIVFLVGFVSVFSYLRLVLTRGSKTSPSVRYSGTVAFGLLLLAAFLYPLRGIPLFQLVQRFTGVLVALGFIGTGFAMIHHFVHGAEEEELRQEAEERNSPTNPRP